MTSLYKCDKCGLVDESKNRMGVRLIPPGSSWKQAVNLDLCVKCTQTYLKTAEPLYLK